jgi:hypothetical protein
LGFVAVTASGLSGCSGGGTGTAPPETTVTPATVEPTSTSSPTRTDSPEPTPTDPESLDYRIRDKGHYTWFPLGQGSWGRQKSPYDMSQGSSRWLAQPTDDGGIRILVKDIDTLEGEYLTAGFDLYLGLLGDITRIEIQSELVRSGQYNPSLVVGLFLDEDENGEFFVWKEGDGDRDEWVKFGGDEEAVVTTELPPGDPVVVDDETNLAMVNRDSASATLGELKDGSIEYHDNDQSRTWGKNRGIDSETRAALFVGLADTGAGDPVEAIVQQVVVE